MIEFKPNPEFSNEDQLLMQKLVDGELNHESRSQWLSSLTDDSPLWRELAFAFVEKQVINEALSDFVSDESEPANAPVILKDDAHLSQAETSSRTGTIMWLVGLATCLLAGFFIGSEFSATSPDTALVQSASATQPIEVSKRGVAEQNMEIDLADALSRSSLPVPNEFRRALMKAGYSVQDKQTITNVSLPSGGQIELPVRNVNVTYVGLDSFQ